MDASKASLKFRPKLKEKEVNFSAGFDPGVSAQDTSAVVKQTAGYSVG